MNERQRTLFHEYLQAAFKQGRMLTYRTPVGWYFWVDPYPPTFDASDTDSNWGVNPSNQTKACRPLIEAFHNGNQLEYNNGGGWQSWKHSRDPNLEFTAWIWRIQPQSQPAPAPSPLPPNCYRIFKHGRLFAVVGKRSEAEELIRILIDDIRAWPTTAEAYTIEPAFIEGIGF